MTTLIASEREDHQTHGHRLPALDGLRGLAVLAVMAFHTDSTWLAGGYLGVDVFFVLSGFLIADILYRQFSAHGRQGLSGFWLRRARRLAPALLVLIAVLSVQRILAPGPGEYDRGPFLAALTYTTNWYEIVRGGTYFGQFGPSSPLLHTWSLAIEEQFYIAFPLVLLGILAVTRRRRAVAVSVGILAVASMVTMLVLTLRGASELRVYMGTDTRAQALLVGAALGIGVGRYGSTGRSTRRETAGWAGLAVLGVTMMAASSPAVLYRGGFAVQAIATAMVIMAALRVGSLQRALSWRPLVWIGTVSYSVYLWHYPIFGWIQGHDAKTAPIGAQVWSIVVTLGIAYLSARFVERPFLRGRFVSWPVARQWLVYAGATALIAVTTLMPAGAFSETKPMQWPATQDLPRSALIMGDSTAFGLDLFFPSDRLPGITHGGTYELGCGFSALPYSFRGGVEDVQRCQVWRERAADYVASEKPEVTVIQSHAWVAFDRVVDGVAKPPGSPEFDEDFKATLRDAIAVGGDDGRIPVYVLKIGCLAPMYDAEIIGDPQRIRIINGLIDDVVQQSPAAHAVDTSDVTCRNGKPVEMSNNPRYRDDGIHWTPKGAEVVWNKLALEMAQQP